MRQVLITISKGIIEQVVFFHQPKTAVEALSRYVKSMNAEHDDAAVYDSDGLVANAKHFLDENNEYVENTDLIEDVAKEKNQSIYIIANPEHRLGFMVVSPDDPLGYDDPVDAIFTLEQMRKDFGPHLKLYHVIPVKGPLVKKGCLEKYNKDCEVEDFDYSLVGEHLE